MNPILSADFKMPDDGLYHVAPQGEFLHRKTGIRQVIDAEACDALVEDFRNRAAAPDFAGVLVDYDHESLDMDKRTEAAGWLQSLEHRPGDGLWGRIRWTDTGETAVRGGRYRFLSPVWKQEDCQDLGEKRMRPRRILNAALTNAPNLIGAAPLANAIPATAETVALLANRTLANAIQPGNERQKRAVFARLRGSPIAASGKTADQAGGSPATYDQLVAQEQAGAAATLAVQQQRLDLAKIIARRKAIEADAARAKPYISAQAEAIKRGIQHAKKAAQPKPAEKPAAKAAAGRSKKASGFSQPKTADQLPTAYVRPTKDRIAGTSSRIGWSRAPAQTAASNYTAALRKQQSIYQYFQQNYANRMLANAGPLSDDQRKAMFARMRGGATRSWTPTADRGRGGFGDFLKQIATIGLGTWRKDKTLTEEQRRGYAKVEGLLGSTGVVIGGGGLSATTQQEISALRERIAAWEEYGAPGAAAAITKAKRTIGIMERTGASQGTAEAIAADLSAAKTALVPKSAAASRGLIAQGAPIVTEIKAAQGRAGALFDAPQTTVGPNAGRWPQLAERDAAAHPFADHNAKAAARFAAATKNPDKLALKRAGDVLKEHTRRQLAKAVAEDPFDFSYENRAPMTDQQRKAMFARENYGGRAAATMSPSRSGDSPDTGTAAGPSPSPSAIDYAPVRASQDRLDELQRQRGNLEASIPNKPTPPPSLAPIDTKQLRAELIRSGKNAGEILGGVAAAEEANRASAGEIGNIQAALRAKGVSKDRLAAETQKELDRRQKTYEKAVADWEKDGEKTHKEIAAIDKKIGEEEIRAKELVAAAEQKQKNADTRAQIAQDKAAAAAKLAAEKKAATDAAKATADAAKTAATADPIKENSTIKRRNRAYGEAIMRGDLALAERLAPGENHAKNAKAVLNLLPDPTNPGAPGNSKALAGILSSLERTAPRDYPRL